MNYQTQKRDQNKKEIKSDCNLKPFAHIPVYSGSENSK